MPGTVLEIFFKLLCFEIILKVYDDNRFPRDKFAGVRRLSLIVLLQPRVKTPSQSKVTLLRMRKTAK